MLKIESYHALGFVNLDNDAASIFIFLFDLILPVLSL